MKKQQIIKKCKSGCKEFWITEALLWGGYLDGKELDCQNKDCTITEIVCKKCGSKYTEEYFDKKNININFS